MEQSSGTTRYSANGRVEFEQDRPVVVFDRWDKKWRIDVPSKAPDWFIEFYGPIPPQPANAYSGELILRIFQDDRGTPDGVSYEVLATERAACKVMTAFWAEFFDANGVRQLIGLPMQYANRSCANWAQMSMQQGVKVSDSAGDPPVVVLPRITKCNAWFDGGDAFYC